MGAALITPRIQLWHLGEVWNAFPKSTRVTFVPFPVVYLYIYLCIPGFILEKCLRQRYLSFGVQF